MAAAEAKQVYSVKGHNWGSVSIAGGKLNFEVDGVRSFDVPLANISQSVVQGKNEVSLEFHDDANKGFMLTEMRIYVPPKPDLNEDEMSAVETFNKELQEKADLADNKDNIAALKDLMFVVPRGRYDISLTQSFFKISGKSYSYKIKYESITKMFLMTVPAGEKQFLSYYVISLSSPIRVGQKMHPHLILTFNDDSKTTLDIQLPEEEFKNPKYKGLLQPTVEGKTPEVVARVFKALSQQKILAPSSQFISAVGAHAVKCAHKSDQGHLFFFDKALFYVPKPAAYLQHSKIRRIYIERLEDNTSRYFDLLIVREKDEIRFSNIDKVELPFVIEFFKLKKLPVERLNFLENMVSNMEDNEGKRKSRPLNLAEDAYLNRLKADAGEEMDEGKDDDEDEDDDDYVAESSDEEEEEEEAGEEPEEKEEKKEVKSRPKEAVKPDAKKRKRADSDEEKDDKKSKGKSKEKSKKPEKDKKKTEKKKSEKDKKSDKKTDKKKTEKKKDGKK